MSPVNCVVVDDTEVDRLVIEEYIQNYPLLKLTGSFSNALEAGEFMKKSNVDLLFLDVDMPVMTGVDFLSTLKNAPLCIFITSHPEYALEAFKLDALDYLVKPVKKDRFGHSITRLVELFEIREKALQYDLAFQNERLVIKEGNSKNIVLIKDILYLEALTNYTKVVTQQKKYITLMSLRNFLKELPADKFIRVHRSFVVAINRVNKVDSSELILGDVTVPVGKTYRRNVIEFWSKN